MAKEKRNEQKKARRREAGSEGRPGAHHSAKETPRLKTRFPEGSCADADEGIRPEESHGGAALNKIVVNMGIGEATQNAKVWIRRSTNWADHRPEAGCDQGQEIDCGFQGARRQPIGAMVTLRGDRMYEFLDRLVNVVLPRVRDFRGVSTKSFDGRGNYTLGLHDQLIFPEIDYAKVDKQKGMNVTIVTTAAMTIRRA
jgi:large subunit ribosomal protein L5